MNNSESVLQSMDDNLKVIDLENRVLEFIRKQYPEINPEEFASILKLIGQHYQKILEGKDKELENCHKEIIFLRKMVEELSQRPQVINISIDKNQEINQP